MRALRFSFLLLFTHRAASSDGIEFSAKQVKLVQEQAADLMYWSQALLSGKTAFFSRTSLRGSDRKIHNAGSDSGGSQPFGDTLAFDYAPSYGVHVDGMQFDAELREAMRATSFLDKHKVRFPPPYHTFALPPETKIVVVQLNRTQLSKLQLCCLDMRLSWPRTCDVTIMSTFVSGYENMHMLAHSAFVGAITPTTCREVSTSTMENASDEMSHAKCAFQV